MLIGRWRPKATFRIYDLIASRKNRWKLNNYEKRIFINSSLGVDDYRRILAAIHKATHEQGYSNIALDFSDCTSAYPCGMLPLISYVRALTKAHIDFSLLLPKDDILSRRFRTSNWAHLLEPRNHDEYLPHQNQSTVPALVFLLTKTSSHASIGL